MYRKLIVLCVFASVARASVIINVFDDVEVDEDGAISAFSSVEGCVESQCNDFCRRAGFRYGKCNNNRCQCTFHTDFSDVAEVEDGGISASSSVEGCVESECNDFCRRAGLRFGTCHNNRCQCTFHAHFTDVGSVEDNSIPTSSSVEGCVESQCNDFCHRAGFRFGTCHNNRCQCTFHADFSSAGDIKDNSITSSVENCVESQCDSFCRRAGFRYGKCNNNRCQCTFHADITDIADIEENSIPASSSVEGCVENQCNDFCRRAGFRFGTCHNNRCQCTFHADATDKSLVHQMHDQISKATAKSCNFQACEQLCRRLGFPGGACVGDKCKCDSFEPITVDGESLTHLPHRAKSHDLKSCNFQSCDQLCRRLGFPGGACVGDRCDCDNFKQDPEVLTDTADEEPRHPIDTKNLISLKDVLLQIRSAVKDCNTITCDDMCHRLNYAGGTCSGGPPGSCMCF